MAKTLFALYYIMILGKDVSFRHVERSGAPVERRAKPKKIGT
jgi:hypothetical protein